MHPPVTPILDTTLGLKDGRRLAYACYGAPEGRPVYLMHGWPGSRLGGAPLHGAAREAGVLLVVPDRPGMGRSDPLAGRSLLSWAEDLAALADHLGHGQFSLLGFSGGGPFALAVLSRLPDRLLARSSDGGPAAALVSSQVPLSDPASRALMPPHVQAVMAMHSHASLATRMTLDAMALGLRFAPNLLTTPLLHGLPEVDRRLLTEGGFMEALGAEYSEALLRGGGGAAHELSLFVEPWGFTPSEIPPRVLLYHGERDANVPVALARRLASELPDPVTRIVPDKGHFWLFGAAGEVFQDLS